MQYNNIHIRLELNFFNIFFCNITKLSEEIGEEKFELW